MVVGVLTAAVARTVLRDVAAFDVVAFDVVVFDVVAFAVLAELVVLVIVVAKADCDGTVVIVTFDLPTIAAFDKVGAALVDAAGVAALVAPVVAIIAAVAGPMAKALPPTTGPPVIPGPIWADEMDEFTVLCGLTTSAGLTNCPVGGVGSTLCAPSGLTLPRTRP
jgi:hypothetical protein